MRRVDQHRARRIALGAQGLAETRSSGRVDVRHVRRLLRRIGALQIDSVNVLERAHHLTLFSRLGHHERGLLWRAFEERRLLFEYWGHEACFLPIEDYPLFRHRMAETRPWIRVDCLNREHPGYVERVLDEVRELGPVSAADLSDPGERRGSWWGWNRGKIALEWLFATGRLAVAGRRNFARRYDLPERVIPTEFLEAPAVPRREAHRRLLLMAARACGVATAPDLADYYRLPLPAARRTLDDLAGEGALELVDVEGWRHPAYLHPEVAVPRRLEAAALLCPFDPVMWNRDRVERVFGFHYRIEIYVPRSMRRWGYYVLPFLLGDRLVGRVDVKADRKRGLLLVPGAFIEPGEEAARVVPPLVSELGHLASWLSLEAVVVGDIGDLAPALRAAFSNRRPPPD